MYKKKQILNSVALFTYGQKRLNKAYDMFGLNLNSNYGKKKEFPVSEVLEYMARMNKEGLIPGILAEIFRVNNEE